MVNAVSAVLCGFAKGEDDEAVKEQERNQRLEENYQFKWNKNENGHRWRIDLTIPRLDR